MTDYATEYDEDFSSDRLNEWREKFKLPDGYEPIKYHCDTKSFSDQIAEAKHDAWMARTRPWTLEDLQDVSDFIKLKDAVGTKSAI
jgi:hypothetical protein